MSIDLDAIPTAIATLFGSVTPPAGEPAITLSTADLPDDAPNERTVLVLPLLDPDWGTGPSLRKAVLQYPVHFLLWQTRDKPRSTKLLRRWATAFYSRMDASGHLGLSDYVAWAAITAGPGTGALTYGGTPYFGLRFVVSVSVWEGISVTA